MLIFQPNYGNKARKRNVTCRKWIISIYGHRKHPKPTKDTSDSMVWWPFSIEDISITQKQSDKKRAFLMMDLTTLEIKTKIRYWLRGEKKNVNI